ncbi:MAG: caspase family protein [Spirochaetes bacterium]|jgi:hypothetical protein|nr:caspase family protein [Spirochaetota bacterium]
MKMVRAALAFMSVIILAGADPLGAKDAGRQINVRRFAIAVGANDGGHGRVKLKYALSDASMIMDVLKKIGGVSDRDGLVLYDPDRNNFISAMRDINARISGAAKDRVRVEFIFYYSGHSDERGLLLGGERIYYREVRDAIKKIPADVKIAILDSCSSGEFVRMKGGKMKSPFILDATYDMKGYAFMTSSSSNEASQESDRIKGSFFTHYLVTGLRGAADMIQDGRITLNESYQFAYSETLSRTSKTMGGPQHPNYNIQMTGTGDVVLTDIRKSDGEAVLDKSISGKLYVYNSSNRLMAETQKPYGRKIELGLDEGKYTVVVDRDGRIYETEIKIQKGKKVNVSSEGFRIADRERTVARGEDGNISGDRKSLISDEKTLNEISEKSLVYVAVDSKAARFKNGWKPLVGLHGGIEVFRVFTVGLAGYGLAGRLNGKDFNRINYLYRILDDRCSLGYGGGFFEYRFFPEKLFNFSIGTLVGAGMIGVESKLLSGNSMFKKKGSRGFTSGRFFIVEPELYFFVNIFSGIRLGAGASYRVLNGLKVHGITNKDLRGYSFGGSLQFEF